jgi:hypothetical protein
MSHLATAATRRVGAVVATLLLAIGGAVAIGSPAHAAPPGCTLSASVSIDGGQNIHAFRYWLCDNGDDIPLSVNIQRFVSPGVWTTVASGTGEADYYCSGHAFNTYRATGVTQFNDTCG